MLTKLYHHRKIQRFTSRICILHIKRFRETLVTYVFMYFNHDLRHNYTAIQWRVEIIFSEEHKCTQGTHPPTTFNVYKGISNLAKKFKLKI